ncbi:UNVERIFIED_CONTAM: hypothetical protein FKN15_067358 [Acipenser sinensis]
MKGRKGRKKRLIMSSQVQELLKVNGVQVLSRLKHFLRLSVHCQATETVSPYWYIAHCNPPPSSRGYPHYNSL